MKILVTGITGFIGQSLLPKLNGADEIFLVSRKNIQGLPANFSVIVADFDNPGDLLGRLKMIRPDTCIHLAWEGIPDFNYEMSFKNLKFSSWLLRSLVEECGCKKIIVSGSCFEYGKTFGACHEADAVTTNSYFTWAKHALYDLGTLLASKNGISLIWFRFFYVYGPGQRAGSLIPMMAEALKKNEAPVVKTPYNANDFIYVDDITEALKLAVHKDVPTGIYNLGSGQSFEVWKICEYLEKAMGKIPSFSQRLRESGVPATANFWADLAKSKTLLGWNPIIKIEEGMRRYVVATEIKV